MFIALCTCSVLGLASCSGDDESSSNGPDAGIITAGCKISKIESPQGSEIWTWEADLLRRIEDESGKVTTTIMYDGNRMSKASLSEGIAGMMDMEFNYAGNKLSQILMKQATVPMATIDIENNSAGRPSHSDVDLSPEMLALMSQFLGLMGGGAEPNSTKGGMEKFSLTNQDVVADLVWGGDNVDHLYLDATINATTTLNEINEMMPLSEMMSDYATVIELALMLYGDVPIPVAINLKDTLDYTYDNHPNPFAGMYFRTGELFGLSANNTLSSNMHGMVNFTVTLPSGIPMVGGQEFSRPMAVPARTTQNSYTYNADGYPETVTDENGLTSHFYYAE